MKAWAWLQLPLCMLKCFHMLPHGHKTLSPGNSPQLRGKLAEQLPDSVNCTILKTPEPSWAACMTGHLICGPKSMICLMTKAPMPLSGTTQTLNTQLSRTVFAALVVFACCAKIAQWTMPLRLQ